METTDATTAAPSCSCGTSGECRAKTPSFGYPSHMLSKFNEISGRPVRARTADLYRYRVNSPSDLGTDEVE
jgi:hypothetical protein